jgi:DNA-binding MarR family transcriptional regulator
MKFKHLDTVDPTTCISGKMNRISRLTANIFRKHLHDFDITTNQLTLLFVLFKSGGKTQKEMTDILYLEKSSLNRNLKKLFDLGYATRSEFPNIKITHEGKILLDQVIPFWEAAMKEIRSLLHNDGEVAIDTILTKLKNA